MSGAADEYHESKDAAADGVGGRYDAEYYEHCLGSPYNWDNLVWQEFFGRVADWIVSAFAPHTVLDAGCGMGFLVGALRARGVDARGFDISEFAISQVPDELRPFCVVGSISDAIDGDYDLIACIEVLEHLAPEQTDGVLDSLAAHTNRILCSSSPDDVEEATHTNLRPIGEWVRAFADRGFLPMADAGAEVVAAQAIVFERKAIDSAELAERYEELRWRLQRKVSLAGRDLEQLNRELSAVRADAASNEAAARRALAALESQLEGRDAEIAAQRDRLERAEAQVREWEEWQSRSGWRLFVALAGLRRRLGPPGSLRDRGLRRLLSSIVAVVDAAHARLSPELPRPRRRRLRAHFAAREAHLRPARILVRRTREVLAAEGPLEVMRRARRWLRRQATTASQSPSGTQGAYSLSIQERYERWQRRHDPDDETLARQRATAPSFRVRPLMSVLVPVFDPPLKVLQEAVESVLGQTYDHLELCVANAGSDLDVADFLDGVARRDDRVRVLHLSENGGISSNSNAALSLASGEFVALLDHDDLLAPHALFAIVESVNDDPDVDVLYSDEDRLDSSGNRILPYLKPHWSPEFLHSYMYTGHLGVYRRSLVESLGGFRSKFDGSQDYDLMLRAAAATSRIRHVPQVLYHWRMIEGSARARLVTTGEKSRPFSLRRVPDRFFNPFGQPTLLEPAKKP